MTSEYELRVLVALRRIMRATDIYSRKLRAIFQLTTPQLICLLAIVEFGPLTLKAVSERAFLSSSTVVGIIDRLEAKGLVERKRDTKDRRVVFVAPTDLGKITSDKAPNPLQERLADGLSKLSESDRLLISDSLSKVAELMDSETVQPDIGK